MASGLTNYDWSSRVKEVAAAYKTYVFENNGLLSIALDLFLFLVVDVYAKAAIGNQAVGGYARKRTVWLIESIFLATLCLVIYVCHHTPIVLLIACLVTLSVAQPWLLLRASWQIWSRSAHSPVTQPLSWGESDDEDEEGHAEMKRERMSIPTSGAGDLRRRPLADAGSLWSLGMASKVADEKSQNSSSGRHSLPLTGPNPKPNYPRNAVKPNLKPSSIGDRLKSFPHDFSSLIRNTSNAVIPSSPSPQSPGRYYVPFIHSYSLRGGTLMPPGLPNGGKNLCFMNSVLQCVSHCPRFEDQLTEVLRSMNSSSRDVAFLQTLSAVLKECQLKNSVPGKKVVATSEFRSRAAERNGLLVAPASKPQLQAQHDAGEFMLWLLESVHVILSKFQFDQSLGSGSEVDNDQIAALLKQAVAGTMNGSGDFIANLPTPSLKKLVYCCQQTMDVGDADKNQFYSSVIQLMSEAEWLHHQRLSSSLVQSLFECQCVAARHCLSCNRVSVTLEPVRMLHLTLPSKKGPIFLNECFEQFGQVELMAGQNLLRCRCSASISRPPAELQTPPSPRGGLTPGQCRSLVRKLPPYLVLQIMRFEYNASSGKTVKLTTPVDFPLTNLDLTKVLFEDAVGLPHPPGNSVLFNLCAIAIHAGDSNPSFGHYYAYCLESDGMWYKFNDELVTQVADMQRECTSLFLRQNVYLLFYSRQPV